uniref:Uncharacterized protein n=1 Tax=Arundo donax TaxID=35708 RepID=A0A0A8YT97_ARUDO
MCKYRVILEFEKLAINCGLGQVCD